MMMACLQLSKEQMNKLQMDIWGKALEGYEEISKVIGFETRMDAFCQGYYVGLNMLFKAGKLTQEDLDAIIHIRDNKKNEDV